jgi:hypothetical protein
MLFAYKEWQCWLSCLKIVSGESLDRGFMIQRISQNF